MRFSSVILIVFTLALLICAGTDPSGFISDLGVGTQIPITGWILAGIAVAIYTTYTRWAVPEIRPVAAEVSWFRALELPLAMGPG